MPVFIRVTTTWNFAPASTMESSAGALRVQTPASIPPEAVGAAIVVVTWGEGVLPKAAVGTTVVSVTTVVAVGAVVAVGTGVSVGLAMAVLVNWAATVWATLVWRAISVAGSSFGRHPEIAIITISPARRTTFIFFVSIFTPFTRRKKTL